MNKDLLKDRTKQFSRRCIKLALALPRTFLGDHIRGQLIRSSTSVASNYRAACLAHSKPHFISKIGIVVEEADESCFWMESIIDEQLFNKIKVMPLLKESQELTAIFVASRKTARNPAYAK